MTCIEILVLEGASPASTAITLELIETANRARQAAGRPRAFATRLSGSAARWARGFLREAPEPATTPADLVVVPGLAWTDEAAVRAGLERRDVQAARRGLQAAAAAGAEIASSCSGVFLLASAGVLDGRRATTTWWLAPLFRRLYPRVALETDAMVVQDGPVTTAGAAMAQLDLMLALIARHADRRLAERCARYLLLDERQSQSRYMALSHLAAADERVARAERWARGRLEQDFSIADLAAAAGGSLRTFARRCERATGLSPVRLVQRLRVERAVELLETTRLTFDEIASCVGYAEPSTLRKLLKREGLQGARAFRAARAS